MKGLHGVLGIQGIEGKGSNELFVLLQLMIFPAGLNIDMMKVGHPAQI
jgi:hypothetical protein